MGAAAELLAVGMIRIAHLYHAYLVAVFFAKECNGPAAHRVLVRRLEGAHGISCQNGVVDHCLNGLQLLWRDGRRMDKVKAQAIRRDQRASLSNVFAQNGAQRLVQQVSGRVVAGDVLASPGVYLSPGGVPHAGRSTGRLSDVDDEAGRRLVGVGHLYLPILAHDAACVADLAAALDVERRRCQHDFDGVAWRCDRDRCAIPEKGHYLTVGRCALRVDVDHPRVSEKALRLQSRQQVAVYHQALGVNSLELLPGSADLYVPGHGCLIASFVHSKAVFLGNVAGQIQGEAILRPEIKGRLARNNGLAPSREIGHETVQVRQPGVQRAEETLFLFGNRRQDELAAGAQFGEKGAHGVYNNLGHLRQERFLEADFAPEAGRPAQDHAQGIAMAFVAWQHAVTDEERHRPAVVSDDPVGHQVFLALFVGVVQQFLGALHEASEQIRIIVGPSVLQHRNNPLKAHACVHVFGRQHLQGAVGITVVLDKDQVPQLGEALTIAVDLAGVAWHVLHVTESWSPVKVDLAARAAGTGIAHFPKVVFTAKVEHMMRCDVGHLQPVVSSFGIAAQIALAVLKDGDV